MPGGPKFACDAAFLSSIQLGRPRGDPVPPERDFKGRDLERGTGIPGAELRGAHLPLPGHGADGRTLEICRRATRR